ncbi:uncharacterized protein [Cardiocondyla obscurior]|uniref:uncharacterized protein n=1 Tax=Cardiocondyla obscurior TaxID=286306 RepID=UPI0039657E5C
MDSFETRVELQKTRFSLIQDAADVNNQEIPLLNRQGIITKISILEQNWLKFLHEHEELIKYKNESIDIHDYIKERYYERGQAFYVFARSQLSTQLSTHLDKPETSRSTSSLIEKETSNTFLTRSSLPRIKLPTFTGDYKSWRAFRDLFRSMIINNLDLTDVERIHYLKTCLSGEAAKLIVNMTASGENFEIAWTLLNSRYENKRFLISAQLDRIGNLKPLKSKNATDLRSLLTTIMESLGALRALDCAVQHWDPILIHQMTRLLDPETREDWEISLGSMEDFPDMRRFQMFLDSRARALENLSTNLNLIHNKENRRPSFVNPRNPSRNIAHTTTINNASISTKCVLCGGIHPLQKCDRYLSMNSSKRKEFVIRKGRCFNCLGAHLISKCRSTTRCFTCGKRHHTSIHNKEIDAKPDSTIASTQASEHASAPI